MRRSRASILGVLALGSTLAASCGSTLEPPSGDVLVDLTHRDPRVRIIAARRAVETNPADPAPADRIPDRDRVIALLIDNLDDDDPAVRFYAGIALRKLAGEDFGYRPWGRIDERHRAIENWREWAASGSAAGATEAP